MAVSCVLCFGLCLRSSRKRGGEKQFTEVLRLVMLAPMLPAEYLWILVQVIYLLYEMRGDQKTTRQNGPSEESKVEMSLGAVSALRNEHFCPSPVWYEVIWRSSRACASLHWAQCKGVAPFDASSRCPICPR